MSLKVGQVFGIEIRIHYSWLIIFFLIAWSLATGYMPAQFPGLDPIFYWGIGILSAIMLFASVLVHELAHSYVAIKQGIRVPSITLFLFGGVSQILEEPDTPNREIKMAFVGPGASFLIAAVFAVLWFVAENLNLGVAAIALLSYISMINALLGGFNLLPAFPLDGGRILRAGLWRWKGNLLKATKLSSKISSGFAYLLMGTGIFLIFFVSLFTGLWLIFIGWFLKNGAETSLRQTIVSQTLEDVNVQRIMTSNVVTISSTTTVEEAVRNFFEKHAYEGYPVTEGESVMGIVSLGDVRAVPVEKRATTKITDIMTPKAKLVTTIKDDPALEAFIKLSKFNVSRLLVLDEDRLVGIVTRSDIMKLIRTRSEIELQS